MRAPTLPAKGQPFGLTAQERRVAALLARGLSNQEIAAELICSPETIRTHLVSIRAKMGAKNRVQVAVEWALEVSR